MKSIHHCSAVNPLVNPVAPGDIIIAVSGARFAVKDNLRCEYWLENIADPSDRTEPVRGQVAICRQIAQLEERRLA